MYKIKQVPEDFIVKERSTMKIGDTGRFSYFLMKKKNYDTVRACQRIAYLLKIPLKFIGFAGNKDKKAITEQVISIKGIVNLSKFEEKDIELKHLGFGDEPVTLGDLEGNEFEIIVETDLSPKEKKIINYFGEQRFSKNNQLVGKAIVKGNLKEACELIDEEKVKRAIEDNPNDFVNAIKVLPKKVITLYVYAFQSFIWNKTVDEYLKESKDDIEIPLVGFGVEYDDDKVEKIIKNILKEEGITERDFIIKQIPEISVEGWKRKVFVDVQELKIEKLDGKYKLKFFLPKSCYATEVIRQLFT